MKKILYLISVAILLSACSTHAKPTLEQQAAGLLITGVRGTSLGEDPRIIEDIKSGIAGVILFELNVAKPEVESDPRQHLSKFVADMKALRPEPLMVAIDQEGGYVNRLKSKYGFRDMPSQSSVGEVNDPKYTREVARMIAQEVGSVGINVNFAPCVDVNINPDCPVIGKYQRPFSADEDVVCEMSKIYVAEHHREGLLTSLKHFPGHGSSLVDSHLGLTDITRTWQMDRELKPYRELINSKMCDMVMVSHLFNSNIDSEYPATLSRPTIDSLLRGVLKWDGVVVTDDMQMKAIVDHYGFDDAITLAINAGVDLFIVGGNIKQEKYSIRERFVQVICDGVRSGKIPAQRVEEASARVGKLLKQL